MTRISRRNLIAGALAGSASLSAPMLWAQGAAHRVVILGGGIGGATAAKYIRMINPEAEVTIIERDRTYYTCPRSNDVITGVLDLDTITFDLSSHRNNYGVKTIYDEVVGVDFDAHLVRTADGSDVPYDRLIVSPGVDLMIDQVEGHSHQAAETVMPHGWKAGPQTMNLRRQFLNLRPGGTVVIVAPPNPFRCPPGPYERASMMADHFRHHNPTAKVIILDPKNKFTKQGPFTKGWERLYGYGTENALLEWVPEEQGGADMGHRAAGILTEEMGTVLAAFILSIIAAFVGTYFGATWSTLTFFVALFVVLLVRPQGLFGEKPEMA